ncbi:Zinc finger, C6HC-type [Corchorus olitorius]|uniref:RBR-type E3 ubiquitin transferase n=1 Tax=Corchorus olitorius TaxID=93759 RepID=A0A1R3IUJ9_9ROSI|nr:Zinc finger, C6HC-type [Corchorus olitorius]
MGNKLQKLKQRSQIEEKSKPEELDSDFTCEICIEPIEANNKFNNNGLCKHNFCSDCIAKHVEEKVTGLKMANIDCPDLDCKFPLDPLSCRPILSKPVFDQWCELLCGETLLQKYELSQRCYCPYPDCAALVVNECNNKPRKSTCPSCKKSFCFQCQSPWHAGYRCGENHIEKSTNDILFGRLVEEQKWTRCPKCGHAVQRTTGCQVIFCREKREFSDRNELLTRKLIKENEWTRCSNCGHYVERNGGYVDMYFAMDVEKQTKLEVECDLAARKCVETIYSAITFLLQLPLSFV